MSAAHAVAGVPTATMAWCTCNQGFSGHEADLRLARHIESPDPTDTGALLIQLLS